MGQEVCRGEEGHRRPEEGDRACGGREAEAGAQARAKVARGGGQEGTWGEGEGGGGQADEGEQGRVQRQDEDQAGQVQARPEDQDEVHRQGQGRAHLRGQAIVESPSRRKSLSVCSVPLAGEGKRRGAACVALIREGRGRVHVVEYTRRVVGGALEFSSHIRQN